MKTKIAMAIIINACVVSQTIAGDIYRWTDPDTRKVLTTSYPPPYSIKEQRLVGVLPTGNLVDVILDLNAPDVKVFVDKHKALEAEKEKKEKEKAAQEAKQAAMEKEKERIIQEARHSAIEKEKERVEKEAEERRIFEEREMIKTAIEKVRQEEKERPIREAEEKRIAAEKAKEQLLREKEQAAREAEERRIAAEKAKEQLLREKEQAAREIEERRIAAEAMQKLQQKITNAKSKKDNDKDIDFMLNIIDEFEQYNKFASSTARINLAIPINNLLSVKVKLNSYKISKCYFSSKNQLQEWMDLTIKSYYAFSAKEEYQSTIYMTKADENLNKFWLDFPDSCGLW